MPSSRRRLAALAAAAVVALPAFTRAASYTWDGSVGGNWFDTLTVNSTVVDTNWTSTFDGGLPLLTSFPSLGDDAIVNSPTANISLTKNNGVNTLSLVSGSNLTVSGNGSAGDVALNAGTIVNNGTLTLRSNDGGFVTSLSVLATLTNNGSFVSAAGAGGARNITGTIQNSGLFSNTGTTNYTGFFINTGSVSNTANFVHVSGNSTFAQRSGTLTTDDANADFTVFGPAAFEFGGAGVGETGGTISGTVVFRNATLKTFGTTGTGNFRIDQSSVQTGVIGPNTSILVQGNGTIGDVTLTLDQAATNNGSIVLQSRDGGFITNLTVGASGTGTVMNTGTISSNVGAGGNRNINGNVVNTGTFNNNGAPTILSGSWTNNGNASFSVNSGSFSLTSGSSFVQHSGTLTVDPAAGMSLNSSTFEFGGTGVGETGGTMNGTIDLFNSTLKTFGTVGTGSFRVDQNSSQSGNVGPNTSILIQGNGSIGDVTLTTDTFVNNGAITLQSRDGGYNSNLTIGSAGAGTLTNAGSISSLAGSLGNRSITGNIVSSGMFSNTASTFVSGSYTNTGSFDISGGFVDLNSSSTFAQKSGSLTIGSAGSMTLSSSTFEFGGTGASETGGTIGGTVVLLSSTLKTFGTSGTGSFRIDQSSTQSGNIGLNTSILVQGNGSIGDVGLTTGPLTNNGAITLQSRDGGYASNLTVGTGTLTNSGVINFLAGSLGPRNIAGAILNPGTFNGTIGAVFTGSFVNTGAFNLSAGAVVLTSGYNFAQRSGTITINPTAGSMTMNGQSTFEFGGAGTGQTGGTISGTVVLLNSTLKTFGTSGVGSFRIDQSSTQTGIIGPNTAVTVEGNGGAGDVALTTDLNSTNAGSITLDSRDGGYGALLNIGATNTGTLTNTGSIQFGLGAGGPRTVNGGIANAGTISNAASTFLSGGNYTNTGAVNDTAGAITVQSGSDFAMRSGTMNLTGGSFGVSNSTFEFGGTGAADTGGTITGTVLLFQSLLKTFGTTGTGNFRLETTSSQSGNIGANTSILVQGEGGNNVSLLVVQDTTNAGSITLQSREAGYQSNLVIGPTNTGTLTNTGTISSLEGTGGFRFITGNIINSATFTNTANNTQYVGNFTSTGTVNDTAGAVAIVNNSDFAQRSGSMNLSGGSFGVSGSTFEFGGTSAGQTGGTMSGTVVLIGSSLLKTFGTTGTGNFRFDQVGTQTGNIGPNTSILIQGEGGNNVQMITDANVANAGSITLQSRDAGYQSNLVIGTGGTGTLTNSGSLTSGAGSGGLRLITGNVVNFGHVFFGIDTNIFGTFTNSGAFGMQSAGYSAAGGISGAAGTGDIAMTASNLTVDYLRQNSLSMTDSAVTIRANGGTGGVSVLNSLSVKGTSSLNLADNDLIVKYSSTSPMNAIGALLASGFAGGNWNGAGINSSAANTDGTRRTALGYGDAADLGITTVDGQATTNKAVIVKYTYYGDSSLDGKVDLGNDFDLFLEGYLGHGSTWELGDYNYDGAVTNADFGMFIDGIKQEGVPLGELESVVAASSLLSAAQKASLLAVVPEPGSAAMVAGMACVFATKRTRRSRRGD